MKTHLLPIDTIDRQQVLAALGYGRDNQPSESMLERVDEIAASMPMTLKGIFVADRIIDRGSGLLATSRAKIASPTFSELASTADQVFFCLVTLGPEFDQRMLDCADTVDALIFDSLGSVLVEQGVEEMRLKLASDSGKHISLPFSPGYCDFPLKEQETIFEILGEAPLGVRYHPGSYMMNPVKTISFITAAGDTPLQTNPCTICQLEQCQMRRSAS